MVLNFEVGIAIFKDEKALHDAISHLVDYNINYSDDYKDGEFFIIITYKAFRVANIIKGNFLR